MGLINNIIFSMSLILIIYFIFIIIKVMIFNRNIKYPPVKSKCPNYFLPEKKMGREFCKARPMYKIYNSKCDIIDTTDMTEAEKCEWSQTCNIYWEGITNKEINNIRIC